MRLTVQRETPDVFLNPGASLTLENNSASGDDWKYRGYTISLFDTVRPNANDTLSLGLDIVRYDYYASFSGRSDTTLNPHLNALHKLSDKWALTGQVSYTTNASTEADDYSYNRFVIGFGVSRSL
jgi:hypothetical protein